MNCLDVSVLFIRLSYILFYNLHVICLVTCFLVPLTHSNDVVVFVSVFVCLFFFFKQNTAYELRISDWSSDVCSSDLVRYCFFVIPAGAARPRRAGTHDATGGNDGSMTYTTDYDLACHDVCKSFGPLRAVDDVSFEIPRGTFFSILGPSGCEIGRAHV